MTVTNVHKDPATRSMTISAEFGASVERVWQLWSDPRQLERWWGPPTYPATFVDHQFSPGGRVAYFMTGPEGDRHHGWWRIIAVDAPHRLDFEDGFAHQDGTPNADLPVTTVRVDLDSDGDTRTRMSIHSSFASVEAMEQLLAMGMDEGMKEAMGQMDALLLEPSTR
jgi:uncharacterized protein YndB with AHSA1/START domain